VIGGGVAGLSVAWRLLADPEIGARTPTAPSFLELDAPALASVRAGLQVTVLERASRLGGNIRCERDRGFLVEWGPNGFLDNAPETPRLCRALGISHRLLPAADAAARRFLFVRGRLHALPASPAAFFASPILSWRGRLRVLGEPFVPPRPSERESVYDFAARRIGREAASTLVDAMVSGVYGGDARRLSLASAFPKMHALERDHGGLVRGMFARMREARRERSRGEPRARGRRSRAGSAGPAGPGGVLTSFDEGFAVLIEELASALHRTGRVTIRCGAAAADLSPPAFETRGARWWIDLAGGERLEADAVVLALPAREAAPAVRSFDAVLAREFAAIPDAPLVVVGLGYRQEDFPAPIDGFGFLVPRGEGMRSLGVLWDSSIYPNRAPRGRALLRVMIGGAQDPGAIELSDGEALAQARNDLALALGLQAAPDPVWIFRHPQGIPQYDLDHPARLARIDARREDWPGLALTGNSYRGISVNHCVERSIPVAREVLLHLARDPVTARRN